MLFEVIGNVFLSKYILLNTVEETINYNTIYGQPDLQSYGYVSLGSALVRESYSN